jgi:hypothetical protein
MNTMYGFDVLEGLLVQHRRFRRNALVGHLLYDEVFFSPANHVAIGTYVRSKSWTDFGLTYLRDPKWDIL